MSISWRLRRPRSKRVFASLSLYLFAVCLWLTEWGQDFVKNRPLPLNMLFPSFTVSVPTAANAYFIFTRLEKPESSSPFLKTLIDLILTLGVILHHVYIRPQYQPIIYWLMSIFAQIYVVALLLILVPTEFPIVNLFIILLGSPLVQFAVDEESFWLALFASVLLGFLLYLNNQLNNHVVAQGHYRNLRA